MENLIPMVDFVPEEENKQEKLHRLIKEKLDENEPKQDFEIISVKRLSDGEIFNVLEKVNFQGTGCSGKHLISKFVITDKKTINVNGCVVEFPLKYIQKLSKQETLEETAERIAVHCNNKEYENS